jgi:hypothetical protein
MLAYIIQRFPLQKIILAIFIGSCAVFSKAQGPGYMGKHLSVGYGFYFAPALFPTTTDIPVNTMHEGFLEYSSAKRFSVGFSVKYYNTRYENSRPVDVNPGNYSSSYYQIDDRPSGDLEIRGINYLLYGKAYRHNYIAPWGKYFIFGINIFTFESTYDPSKMKVKVQNGGSYTNTYYYFNSFGSPSQSFTRFDILIGNGRSRIFADRIVVDYGYNVNLLSTALSFFDIAEDRVFEDNVTYASEYIEISSAARIRGVNRFNLFLKIGYLF